MARTVRLFFVLALMTLTLLVAACSKRVSLFAPATTLPSGVHVRVHEAYVDDERVFVKMWVMNTTQAPIRIDRDGVALRLPDGQVLPRSSGVTTRHNVYEVAPGQGRDVFVDFRAAYDLDLLTEATVILGGVSFGTDPTPRVAGEVPLSTVFVQGGDAPMAAPPPPPAAEPESAPTAPASPAPGPTPAPSSGQQI